MKLALVITTTLLAVAGTLTLGRAVDRQKLVYHDLESTCDVKVQQLAATEALTAALNLKVSQQREQLKALAGQIAASGSAEVLSETGNDAPADLVRALMADESQYGFQTSKHILVSKAALSNSVVRPWSWRSGQLELTSQLRGVLAITPSEQQALQDVFTDAAKAKGAWARENLLRDGPTNNTLFQYTIPPRDASQEVPDQKLFSDVGSIIGSERAGLMQRYYDYYHLVEDGSLGVNTNILIVSKMDASSGYGFRAGSRWSNGGHGYSEAMNTEPVPVQPQNFPAAFRFVFPGGWQEVAAREGLQLPPEFNQQ